MATGRPADVSARGAQASHVGGKGGALRERQRDRLVFVEPIFQRDLAAARLVEAVSHSIDQGIVHPSP